LASANGGEVADVDEHHGDLAAFTGEDVVTLLEQPRRQGRVDVGAERRLKSLPLNQLYTRMIRQLRSRHALYTCPGRACAPTHIGHSARAKSVYGDRAGSMLHGLRRQRLQAAFGTYVDPALAARLLEQGDDIFTGESREVTVMFVDVRDFTPVRRGQHRRGRRRAPQRRCPRRAAHQDHRRRNPSDPPHVDALASRPRELIDRGSHALKGKSAEVQVFGLDPQTHMS